MTHDTRGALPAPAPVLYLPAPRMVPDPTTPEPRDVVAIDGPSGAGKSTVARLLADRLGFAYLDTGAMYRAVTWHFLENQHNDLADATTTASLLDELRLELSPGGRVSVAGRDVTTHLRSREVESRVSAVSALPAVRAHMRVLQRQIAAAGPVVAEGRDTTSIVFPAARWKFFLDADPDARGHRRFLEVRAKGREVSEAEILEEMAVRDRLDSTRRDAPLAKTQEAIYVDATRLSPAEVVAAMLAEIERKGRS